MVKILLVEDNEMNRDMLSRRLKRKGYEIVVTVDGQEGVYMATSELPSVIFGYESPCYGRFGSGASVKSESGY